MDMIEIIRRRQTSFEVGDIHTIVDVSEYGKGRQYYLSFINKKVKVEIIEKGNKSICSKKCPFYNKFHCCVAYQSLEEELGIVWSCYVKTEIE